jgi:hypothetical protein
MGAGAFEEYGQFDPNDRSRITLPWTNKSVDIVFKMFMKEFNAAALQWTKGTGGGNGAPLNYVIWQTRHPLAFCTYGKQNTQLYITPVYMFDNEYV